MGQLGRGEDGLAVSPRSARRRRRGRRAVPRWRCCRWRRARTGTRPGRRRWRPAGSPWSAARPKRWRSRPRVCCGSGPPVRCPGTRPRPPPAGVTTRAGLVVPMVSPRQSPSAPSSTARRVTSTVRWTGVGPSKGQSQAVATITSTVPAASWTTSATSRTAARAAAVGRRTLARLCPSAAETTYSIVRMPGRDGPPRAVGDWPPAPTTPPPVHPERSRPQLRRQPSPAPLAGTRRPSPRSGRPPWPPGHRATRSWPPSAAELRSAVRLAARPRGSRPWPASSAQPSSFLLHRRDRTNRASSDRFV